ncbi:MAG: adenylate/guanylate cyclase domain-containing protein [Anaerolineae bacterium]
MPTYLWIHPVLSGGAIGLILLAYALKATAHKARTAHYAAGAGALVLMLATIGVALWAVARHSNEAADPFPPVITIHLIVGIIAALLMTGQAALGGLMRLDTGNIPQMRPLHAVLAPVLAMAVTVQAGLGLTVLYEIASSILPDPVRALGAVIVLGGLMIAVRQLINRQERTFKAIDAEPGATGAIALAEGADTFHISYVPDDLSVVTTTDRSILQTSLQAGIPHTHVCGGNARCSTCRVLVLDGLEQLPPRNQAEQVLADRLSFEPWIRLACQTRPQGTIRVRRLVLDEDDVAIANQLGRPSQTIGVEREVAVMFVDIRGFTTFAESLPPYDVVHALNRYYRAMGRVFDRYNGTIANTMGDGLLVLFQAGDVAVAAWNAVQAALAIEDALVEVRPYFLSLYGDMVDVGVGIHAGSVVLGSVGAVGSQQMTAIGDVVNTASRIESANKQAGTRILISDAVFAYVQDRIVVGQTVQLKLKGKTGEFVLREVIGLL